MQVPLRLRRGGTAGAWIALGLAVALLVGCGGDDGAATGAEGSGVTEHPVPERIPYRDQAALITKRPSLDALARPPAALKRLDAFLNEAGTIDTTRLDVLVEEAGTVDIAALTASRFAILGGNRLYEHSTGRKTTRQIAETGNGPGELKWASGLARDASRLHVGRADNRIDHFNCSARPCEYRETTRLRFSATAVAPSDSGLAVVGQPVLGREGMKIDDWGAAGGIQVVDSAGTIRRTAGRAYETTHFLVLSNYTRGSSLVRADVPEAHALSYEKLPYLWTFASDESDPRSVWKIKDYRPLQMEVFPDEGRISKRYTSGYSTLRVQGPVAGRFIVPTVRHWGIKDGDVRPGRVDYYAIDLQTGSTYFVGTDAYGADTGARLFLVSGPHQVLVEDGTIATVQ